MIGGGSADVCSFESFTWCVTNGGSWSSYGCACSGVVPSGQTAQQGCTSNGGVGITREMLVVEGYVTTRLAWVTALSVALQLKRSAVVLHLAVGGTLIPAFAQEDLDPG